MTEDIGLATAKPDRAKFVQNGLCPANGELDPSTVLSVTTAETKTM